MATTLILIGVLVAASGFAGALTEYCIHAIHIRHRR